jgi:hypothetical protein
MVAPPETTARDYCMTPTKLVWQKPELIILARSRPEESVLLTCKGQPGIRNPGTGNCGRNHARSCLQIGTS